MPNGDAAAGDEVCVLWDAVAVLEPAGGEELVDAVLLGVKL